MTRKQLEHKIEGLKWWVENNPHHDAHQHNLNLLKHYQFQLSKLNNLNA